MILFTQIYRAVKRYFHPSNSSLMFVVFFSLVLNLIFGSLFYYFEKAVQPDLGFIDSLWWAMVTMTTVGYGDFFAKTIIGRFLISYPTMLLGIGIIGYLVGIVADFILEFSSKKRRGLMSIIFKNHVIICNFPNIDKIKTIVEELREDKLYKKSKFVIITDKFQELPEELKKIELDFVFGSPTNEDVLIKSNILESAGVIILAENIGDANSDERVYTIGSLIELLEREHNIPLKTVVEVTRKDNLRLLKRANVDGMISTDGFAGALIVQEFLFPGLNDIFKQIITNKIGSQFFLHETKLTGKKIFDIQLAVLHHDINIQIIGVIHNEEQILNPPKSLILDDGDKLIILSENRADIESIEKEILAK